MFWCFYQMCLLWRSMIWNYAYFVDPISRKREVISFFQTVWIVIHININKLSKIYNKIRQKFCAMFNYIFFPKVFYQMCLGLWFGISMYLGRPDSRKRYIIFAWKLCGLLFVPIQTNWPRFIIKSGRTFVQCSIIYFTGCVLSDVFRSMIWNYHVSGSTRFS